MAGGELDKHHARSELLKTALAIGLPEPESRQTLDSAFRGGAREPRSAPTAFRDPQGRLALPQSQLLLVRGIDTSRRRGGYGPFLPCSRRLCRTSLIGLPR